MALAQPAVHPSSREDAQLVALKVPPHSVEAEQSLLGAILVNNDAMHHLNTSLTAEHFYAPVHQRIFAAAQSFL